jgi:hypothetical protein
MYFTTDVLIRNIAPNKKKFNYSENIANDLIIFQDN